MPRIAHVISTPAGMGGAERILLALLRDGAKRNFEQAVFNPFERADGDSSLHSECSPYGYDGASFRGWIDAPRARWWLGRRLNAFKPDIVHTHLFHALVAVASLRRRPGTVRILTHHHGDVMRQQGRRFDESLDRVGGRRFDRVVAVSDFVRRFLISEYGYPPSKVIFIPNGWEGKAPATSGLAPNPTMVCTANLRPEKGHAVLISAFAQVRKRLPQATLVLVGDGVLAQDLRDQAERLGVLNSVRFAGAVQDVWPFLEDAHVFVLASTTESLGITVMEAMAAGLPVVATEIGGIPELVRAGETGELVPPGDDAALSQRLVELLESPAKRRQMGEAGRIAAQSWRMADMVRQYFRLYDDLLET